MKLRSLLMFLVAARDISKERSRQAKNAGESVATALKKLF